MSTDPTVDQIDVEIADRAATGFTEDFRNGSQDTQVTPLIDLQEVQDRRARRAAAASGGTFRLSEFDPYL